MSILPFSAFNIQSQMGDIARACNLTGSAEDQTSVLGNFFAALGVTDTVTVSDIACLPEEDFKLHALQTASTVPTPPLQKAGLFRFIAAIQYITNPPPAAPPSPCRVDEGEAGGEWESWDDGNWDYSSWDTHGGDQGWTWSASSRTATQQWEGRPSGGHPPVLPVSERVDPSARRPWQDQDQELLQQSMQSQPQQALPQQASVTASHSMNPFLTGQPSPSTAAVPIQPQTQPAQVSSGFFANLPSTVSQPRPVQPPANQDVATQLLSSTLKSQEAIASALQSLAEAASGNGGLTGSNAKKIKLSQVTGPLDTAVINPLPHEEIVATVRNWQSFYGRDREPPPEEDCSEPQLAALKERFVNGPHLGVDFSTWGPFQATRNEKANRLLGFTLGQGGSWLPVELFGPPDFASWEACWKVFQTGCFNLGGIDLGLLKQCHRDIKRRASIFGQECWALIYQADHRARHEHWPKVMLKARMRDEELIAQRIPPLIEEGRPWNHSFDLMLRDRDWWYRNVDQACTFGHLKGLMRQVLEQAFGTDAVVS